MIFGGTKNPLFSVQHPIFCIQKKLTTFGPTCPGLESQIQETQRSRDLGGGFSISDLRGRTAPPGFLGERPHILLPFFCREKLGKIHAVHQDVAVSRSYWWIEQKRCLDWENESWLVWVWVSRLAIFLGGSKKRLVGCFRVVPVDLKLLSLSRCKPWETKKIPSAVMTVPSLKSWTALT